MTLRATTARLALEAIRFQKMDFFNELTMLFRQIKQIDQVSLANAAYFNLDEFTELVWCIKEYTSISVVFDEGMWSTYLPRYRDNHVLSNDFDRLAEKLRKTDGAAFDINYWFKELNTTSVLGAVDRDNGVVHGYYALSSHLILMPRQELQSNHITAEEHAAVLLHEIGHIFTYCEYMSRSVSTNIFLEGLLRASNQSDSVRVDYIHTAEDKGLLSSAQAAAILGTASYEEVVCVLAQSEVQKCVSELGDNIYDTINCEALADQFVVRHNAARHLATYMLKTNMPFRNYYLSQARATSEMIEMVLFFLEHLSSLGIKFMLLLRMSKYAPGKYGTYDDDKTRITRMKHECIERLKDRSLSNKVKQRILEDIEVISQVEKVEINDRHWFEKVLFFFKPGERKKADFVRLQQELERLAQNRLFVSASMFDVFKHPNPQKVIKKESNHD